MATPQILEFGNVAPSKNLVLEGQNVVLVPLNEYDEQQLDALTSAALFSSDQWTYTPYGPFRDKQDFMKNYILNLARQRDAGELVPLVVCDKNQRSQASVDSQASDPKPIGMLSFMNIDVKNRRLEIGSIWYRKDMWRSYANTETCYLAMKHAFEVLNYRRVEWKCHSENWRSSQAAEKLGFKFEGLFRQHMIIKGRNRDSLYFSIIDSEWKETVREHIEQRMAKHTNTSSNSQDHATVPRSRL